MAPTEKKLLSQKFSKDDKDDEETLDWIALRKEINAGAPQTEGGREKMIRKIKDNPLVPVGCLTTAGVLSYGLWCMRKGDSQKSQMMMRARVAVQGLTVGALLLGIVYSSFNKPENKSVT